MKLSPGHALVLATSVLVGSAGLAQTAPKAGETLQQLQPPPVAPRPNPEVTLPPTPKAAVTTSTTGATVVLHAFHFVGNTQVTTDELQHRLANALGQPLDLAGLRQLAERIDALYRARGYPFARAVLPPQDLKDGTLQIDIFEGRYGQVTAESADSKLAQQAQRFLAPLQPGAVIATASLERAVLILNDQPGVATTPVIKPGTESGTGDLGVKVDRTALITGDVGLDNWGSRFSGQYRAQANVAINSPFQLGDQITLRTLASNEDLLLGSLNYNTPLGTSGLRGSAGYAYTSYELGKEFANLGATGVAKVTTGSVSYPLIRSMSTNLSLTTTFQSKELHDERSNVGLEEERSSISLPISLQFDRRDLWCGGGITYGSVSWTPGRLDLDANLTAADTTDTRGTFHKFNVDVVRIQYLPQGWSLMGRINAQAAANNLDSSEKLSLGGASGIRAYPTGEATGDQGLLAQAELRYAVGAFTPYLFVDAGRIYQNTHPTASTTANERDLSGVGLGVRFQRNRWSADLALAWRTSGGAPESDTSSEPMPRIWLRAGYGF
jgi:hemolysin activation/secretion protein